jgi:serine phosphatase RsbU (regulator of sigma subunit)
MKKITTIIVFICLSVNWAFSNTSKVKIDSIIINVKDYSEAVQEIRKINEADLLLYTKSVSNDLTKAKIYNGLCWKYFSSDPLKAMEFAKLQYQLVGKLTDKDAIINAYDNMAWLYQGFSNHEASIKFMLKALKEKELIGDTAGVSISISGLASNYYKLNNYHLALNYFEQTLKIEELYGRELIMAAIHTNIGLCYVGLNDVNKGLKNYLAAVDIYKESNEEIEAATVYGNIGYIYLEQKKYEEALVYLKKSAKYHEQTQALASLATVYGGLSNLYLAQNDFDKALFYSNNALEKALSSNSKSQIMSAHSTLALVFYKNKNYQKAYDHFKISYDLKDTIYSTSSSEQIAEMQTKYDTEKKEAENLLLVAEQKLDRAEIKQKNTQQNLLLLVMLLILFVVVYVVYSLQQKKRTNKLLLIKNDEIITQKEIIEEKNKDITDSINYAQRIQDAILPDLAVLNKHFKSFVYYKPKDIISGDFYWIKEVGGKIYFSVVDCTGHGVPGALMSMIGYNSLNKIVEDLKIEKPGEILDELNKLVNQAFNKEGAISNNVVIKDGMDISICVIDKLTNKLEYAGAKNALYLYRNQNVKIEGLESAIENDSSIFYEIKPNKMKIGGGRNNENYFTHAVQLQKNDSIYLFSDGYADQFGGEKGKKFMYKPFKRMLLSIQHLKMEDQQAHIDKTFNTWKGGYIQLDDVCIMGVRI